MQEQLALKDFIYCIVFCEFFDIAVLLALFRQSNDDEKGCLWVFRLRRGAGPDVSANQRKFGSIVSLSSEHGCTDRNVSSKSGFTEKPLFK